MSNVPAVSIATKRLPVPGRTQLDPRPNRTSGLTRAVEQLFERMVAKDSDQRYQQTGELLQDIEACFEEFGHMWMIKRYLRERKGRMGRGDLSLDENV